MSRLSLGSLLDHELLQRLNAALARDRATTVELLVLLAEIEGRRLYRSAGYDSMFEYCRGAHAMSEDIACHRLRTARAARRFPVILDILADRRLTVTGVSQLAKHLTPANAPELLEASVHRSLREIRWTLAQRFPHEDVPTSLRPLAPEALPVSLPAVEGPVTGAALPAGMHDATPPVSIPVGTRESTNPVQSMGPLSLRPRVEPLAPQRFALQVTIDQETHDLLRYAQALAGPAVAPHDVAEVLKRSLAAYTARLEKQKLGSGKGRSRGSDDPRHIPVHVRREVWERDGGQCAFTSATGRRCECRSGLQFDHIIPVGKGGDGSSAANVRLLCATHNRLEAERAYGEGYMREKVDVARGKARSRRERSPGLAPRAAEPGVPTEPRAAHTGTIGSSEARVLVASRRARALGKSPADVLQSRDAASAALAEVDRLVEGAA